MKINIGIWIGIVCGLVGIIGAIVSVLATGGEEGIYVAAGIFIMGVGMFYLFYRVFFAPVILMNHLKKNGISGKAVVREVHDTGVTINNNPQVKLFLEIKNSQGQKYSTTIRTLVSRLQPNLFQPGMTIPVLIDPKNQNKMAIDYEGNFQADNQTGLSSDQETKLKDELAKLQQQNDMLKLSGKSARAIVKKYTFLGVNINGNNPYAELEIEVIPDDAPAFAATVKGAIKEESVPKYQPGEEIFVKYDYYDLKKVAIDHS